jgi:hypothetical protein
LLRSMLLSLDGQPHNQQQQLMNQAAVPVAGELNILVQARMRALARCRAAE